MLRSLVNLVALLLCGTADAAELRGRVLDPSGNAITQAQVTAQFASGRRSTRTDESGRFNFPSVETGRVAVTVTAGGFATATMEAAIPSEDLTISLHPGGVREQVVVTPARGSTALVETPASLSVMASAQLETSGAITFDQKLRVVPGFTLFRRASSLTANPTAQGVSLRGIGGSGASRALVVREGVPLNDPFGGWVYWTRVPTIAADGVEVLRGGASHLYGSDALSGVIHVLPLELNSDRLVADVSMGSQWSRNASLLASGEILGFGGTFLGQTVDTDGYIQVRSTDKGAVDTPAGARFGNTELTITRPFYEDGRLFLRGAFFNESRANGTPLQTNSTRIADASAALSKSAGANLFRFQLYGGAQRFTQSFSAIAADRDTEALTRTQQVPAQQFGGSMQWSRAVRDRHALTAGLDLRQVRGVSNEVGFASGVPTTRVSAGGQQRTIGFFGQDVFRLHRKLSATLGGRLDVWKNFGASSRSAPFANPSAISVNAFASQTESTFSPHAGIIFQATESFALTASAYGAYRAPTLNELYRAFRVGNVLTLANDGLQAERLYGGEFGARYLAASSQMSAVFFWSETQDPVSNRTLSVTPSLITRQRQNLGQTRSRGIELEARHRLGANILVGSSFQFVDSTVIDFPTNRGLEGLQLPQVPRNQLSFYASYAQPHAWTVTFTGRFSGQQFDDDQNLLPLANFFSADIYAARHLTSYLEIYAAAENVFDERYEVARTPVVSIGPPVLARLGIKLRLQKR